MWCRYVQEKEKKNFKNAWWYLGNAESPTIMSKPQRERDDEEPVVLKEGRYNGGGRW